MWPQPNAYVCLRGESRFIAKLLQSLVIESCYFTSFWNAHLNCISTRCDLTTFKYIETERLRESNRALFRFKQFSQNSKNVNKYLDCYSFWKFDIYNLHVNKSVFHWNRRLHWKNHAFETRFLSLLWLSEGQKNLWLADIKVSLWKPVTYSKSER